MKIRDEMIVLIYILIVVVLACVAVVLASLLPTWTIPALLLAGGVIAGAALLKLLDHAE